MELHRIKLVNFRQHVDTEIELGPGITAIIGPNGSGKTTILEAMGWAFYGLKATRGNKDGIRWSGAGARSPVRVEIEFSLNGHSYLVTRGLHAAQLFLDGGSRPVVDSATEVTTRVRQMLGMDRDEFFNTYFTSQKELAVMAALGPMDRGKFLSRILGYEKLKTIQERLGVSRKELRAGMAALGPGMGDGDFLERELTEAQTRLEASRNALVEVRAARESADRELAVVGPQWTSSVERRERQQSLISGQKLAQQKVNEARNDVQRVDRELAGAIAARNELTEIGPQLQGVEALRAELEGLEREAQKAGQKRSLQGQLEEVDSELERLAGRLEELKSVEGQITGVESAIEKVHRELHDAQELEEGLRTHWVQDRQEAETKRESLASQYKDVAKHRKGLAQLGPEGSCPMCQRVLGDEFHTVIESLGAQLEEIEINGKFFQQRVRQLAEQPQDYEVAIETLRQKTLEAEDLTQQLARLQGLVDEARQRDHERRQRTEHRDRLKLEFDSLGVAYDAERHDAVRAELQAIQPAVERAIALGAQAEKAGKLLEDAERAEKGLSEREAEAALLVEAIDVLAFDETAYAEARELNAAAEEKVRLLELNSVSSEADVRAAEVALSNVAERMAERARRLEAVKKLKQELKVNESLDLTLKNLRNELNATMRPEISEIASEFLSDLTDGRYRELELDEQYKILIVEDGESKSVISGGEEDIANLVLRLAISQMVADRSGHPLSLLVLDEVFGSLDESRRHNVVDLLRKLGDRFPQVVLISHIESVRDGVDRVISVSIDQQTGASLLKEEQGGAYIAA